MGKHNIAYWCVNFDAGAGQLGGMDEDYVLRHGLRRNVWLMQYQYDHYGHDYQVTKPFGNIKKNWNAAGRISVGDWCAAYLRGCRFYAIGKVISPRKRRIHRDEFERTHREGCHLYFSGTVAYSDASDAFYEDFSDAWSLPLNNPDCVSCQLRPNRRKEIWLYPQRVDVNKWEYQVEDGVDMSGEGLAEAVIWGWYRNAAFQISELFFNEIRRRLQQATGE
jgi:hypothetical protein